MVLAGPVCAAPGGAAAMAGMPGMGSVGPPVCEPSAAMPAMPVTSAAGSAVMLLAHVAATVATALLLAYGERLLATLPALLLASLRRWAHVPVVPALVRPLLRPRAASILRTDRLVVGRESSGGSAGPAHRRSRALT